MTKDVIECINERRSVRKFTDEPVLDSTVGRLLEAAVHAPSGGNVQPWFFYVVKNESFRRKVAESAHQGFVAEAPVVIVVCANPEESGQRYGERGKNLYCIQDTAAAVQNILLAAWAFGLGTCWVGAFSEDGVKQALDIPDPLRPVAIVPVGYPADERENLPRKPLDEVVKIVN